MTMNELKYYTLHAKLNLACLEQERTQKPTKVQLRDIDEYNFCIELLRNSKVQDWDGDDYALIVTIINA